MSDGSVEIAKLKGWPAVAVLVAVVGFGAVKSLTARRSLDTEARECIEEQIHLRYARQHLAALGDRTPTEAEARDLLATANVEVRTLDVRGPLDDMVARVEATVDGGTPPGEEVSYWRLEYGSVTGWRVVRPADRVAWWLALL